MTLIAVSFLLCATAHGAAPPAAPSEAKPAPGPAASDSATKRSSNAPAQAEAAAGSPAQVHLKAADGHTFFADEYVPTSPGAAPIVLLVPDLAQTRGSVAKVAARLRDLGYHVLATDNTGQSRHVETGPRGVRKFDPIDTRILDRLLLDIVAAGQALRERSTPDAAYGVVGYGIGANVALLYAVQTPGVGGLALVLPGHNCESYDAADLIAAYGRRPLLLIESKAKGQSDISQTMMLYIGSGNDPSKERVGLPRANIPASDHEDFGMDELIDWVQRHLPVPKP